MTPDEIEPAPGPTPAQRWPKTPQSVIWIVLDDCGVQEFPAWGLGSDYPPTPNIDALLASGIRFDRGYAAPVCGPTRACVQTGRYGFRTGFGGNVPENGYWLGKPPAEEFGIASTIRAGRPNVQFDLAFFGKVHLGPLLAYDLLPTDLGFDFFKGSMANDAPVGHYTWRKVTNESGVASSQTITPQDKPAVEAWSASVNVADALNWLKARSGPFFMLLCLNPPHGPFEVPPYALISAATIAALQSPANGGPWEEGDLAPAGTDPASTAQRIMIYKAALEAADTCIGILMDGIPASVKKNLTVMLCGDNGTESNVVQPPYDPTRAKRTVFEFGVRVPFLISGPRVASPGRASDVLAHAVDLWRTALDIMGVNLNVAFPNGRTTDGFSLMPLMRDPNAGTQRDFLFVETFLPDGAFVDPTVPILIGSVSRAYSDGDYKCIVSRNRERFYHLAVDPLELLDLNDPQQHTMTPAEQARFDELKQRLHALLAS
ncbi:MAG: sulfatase-like hydrolase/transferase [Planctomycetota bacterium]